MAMQQWQDEHLTRFGAGKCTSWFYEAVGVSVGMMGRTVGFGQVYLETAKDREGHWLDGSKTYHLRIVRRATTS
jgi:hypothetical protein